MRPRFQADENLNAKIIAGLLRREPSLDFQTAKTAGILGLADLDVPAHFDRFISSSTSAGLLIVSQKFDLREAIEQILLIWAASEAEEWINQVGYLPL